MWLYRQHSCCCRLLPRPTSLVFQDRFYGLPPKAESVGRLPRGCSWRKLWTFPPLLLLLQTTGARNTPPPNAEPLRSVSGLRWFVCLSACAVFPAVSHLMVALRSVARRRSHVLDGNRLACLLRRCEWSWNGNLSRERYSCERSRPRLLFFITSWLSRKIDTKSNSVQLPAVVVFLTFVVGAKSVLAGYQRVRDTTTSDWSGSRQRRGAALIIHVDRGSMFMYVRVPGLWQSRKLLATHNRNNIDAF